MMEGLNELNNSYLKDINTINTLEELENIKISYLGKKGKVTKLMSKINQVETSEKASFGKGVNILKQDIVKRIDEKKSFLQDIELEKQIELEKEDITLPIYKQNKGTIHPVTQTIEEIISIFGEMGFKVTQGPSIEDEWYNFEALNIGKEHPARQEHDTFYLRSEHDEKKFVLRTHTSPVQIRTMEKSSPPIKIICPGRTYRADSDATHTPMFHQIELLLIDENINMGHLKGYVMEFCRKFFNLKDLPLRFRPSYFPFTEPSAEIDIRCERTNNTLKIGKGKDWLEILGSGVVHPQVLKNCGIDPEKYQGIALGMGIERIAMLKYGIQDLRTFYESDLRWLKHYGFRALEIPNLLRGE